MLKPGGVLTYCNLTSIGVLKGIHISPNGAVVQSFIVGEYESWQELWEKTQLPHVRACGFNDAGIKPIRIFPVTPDQVGIPRVYVNCIVSASLRDASTMSIVRR